MKNNADLHTPGGLRVELDGVVEGSEAVTVLTVEVNARSPAQPPHDVVVPGHTGGDEWSPVGEVRQVDLHASVNQQDL